MKKFLSKVIVFSSPLVLYLVSLIITDPYKILWDYENYTTPNFDINRHYVSTQYYLDNNKQYNYNAFIFGNSRSLAFKTEDWNASVTEPDFSPYHFDGTGESMTGIFNKLKLVDSLSNIEYAILLFDRLIFLEPDYYEHHLFKQHYAVTSESKTSFYLSFFGSVFNYKFLPYYFNYLSGGLISKLSGKIPKDFIYATVTNDIIMQGWNEALDRDEEGFFSMYNEYFIDRPNDEVILDAVLSEKQIITLKKISAILDKNNTDYKIIISPDYRFIKFNPEDLKVLEEIFGADSIHDFSGKTEISENIRNFYDGSHYRPYIGRRILQDIYK